MTIIYHNPNCSKSRETVQILIENNIHFETRLYLKNPPTTTEIKALVTALGFTSAQELLRQKDTLYQELNLTNINDEVTLIKVISENPKLIERPIVIDKGKAKIGRPPESVLSLFE